MHRKQTQTILGLLWHLVWPSLPPGETPPRDRSGGAVELYPEAVDVAAFTAMVIFTLADWETNTALLIVVLGLRWLRRRAA
jgi:hypothetical protein